MSMPKYGHTKPEPAETGHPETLCVFAAWMKVHVILKGPIKCVGGKSTKDKGKMKLTIQIPTQKPIASENNMMEATTISRSGQIDVDTMASIDYIPHKMPNRALGTESLDNAIDALFPPQILIKHMQDSVSGIELLKELIRVFVMCLKI